MKNSRILKLEINEPTTIALATTQTLDVYNDFGKPQVLFSLADQKRLYATPELARQIKELGVREFESFSIRKYKSGRNVNYDVWLAPATEKRRAAEEAPEIAAELLASIPPAFLEPEQKAKVTQMPAPQPAPVLAPTGTDGAPQAQAKAQPVLALAAAKKSGGVIPFNVAFREVTRFVVQELKECGEQWTDQSRQDIVSTILIAAAKNGVLGIWERENAA